jgi:cyclophilin family peptidyl-prolyl cis-trans isomerase
MSLLALALALVPQDAPRLGPERVVLRTACGDLALAFYPDVAPKTVAQVLALARAGAYDGTKFRPAVTGYYLQALGHTSRSAPLPPSAAALVKRLPAEFGKVPHRRGELSMSRHENDPDSAETSFSIILGEQPGLDGRYTVFGRVERGDDVLALLERVAGTRPQFGLTIDRAEVLASAAELEGASLRGPSEPPLPSPERLGFLLACWGVLLAVGGAMAWLPARVLAPRTRTLVLVGVLVAAFPLFLVSLETAPASGVPLFSLAVFGGAVLFFRIMGRFEGPASKPSPPSSTAT